MRVLVYTHRNQQDAALKRCAELRADGETALWRDVRGFAGDIERCGCVETDHVGVRAAHEARGIEVRPFTRIQAPAAGGGDPIQMSECVVVAGSDSAEALAAKMDRGAKILASRGVRLKASPDTSECVLPVDESAGLPPTAEPGAKPRARRKRRSR